MIRDEISWYVATLCLVTEWVCVYLRAMFNGWEVTSLRPWWALRRASQLNIVPFCSAWNLWIYIWRINKDTHYLSIPNFQRLHCCCLEIDKWFHPTLYWNPIACLFTLGLNLSHVSKSGHTFLLKSRWWWHCPWYVQEHFVNEDFSFELNFHGI